MDLFARAFVLVFSQLAVGGFLCLSIPPFQEVERGYYRSSAVVYLLLAVLAFLGHVSLWLHSRTPAAGAMAGHEVVLWAAFVTCAGVYFASLWGDRFALRARSFAATWVVGFLALAAAAQSYRHAPLLSVETVLFPASFILSAMVLGAAASGMLLGHWYLIGRDLSLTPLWRVLHFFLYCLAAQVVLLLTGCLALALAGGAPARNGLQLLASDYSLAFLCRLAISPAATAVLGIMVWRTLRIGQTMAATGLFYIAMLAALVGALLGCYLLFRTGLPV